jgi:hypothetical protein
LFEKVRKLKAFYLGPEKIPEGIPSHTFSSTDPLKSPCAISKYVVQIFFSENNL